MVIIQILIPATGGYINVGDVIIFTSAILFGPMVGALAGGIGSAVADILFGYPAFAPYTFVIKGLEGFVAGYISRDGNGFRDVLALSYSKFCYGCRLLYC